MLWMGKYAEKMLLIFIKLFFYSILRQSQCYCNIQVQNFSNLLRPLEEHLLWQGTPALERSANGKTALPQTSWRNAFHRKDLIKVIPQHSSKAIKYSELIDFNLTLVS